MDDLSRDLLHRGDPVAWTEDTVEITPDPWQVKFLCSEARNIHLRCCRQSGKSTFVGIRAAHRMRFRKRFIVCTAPSERQSLELFEKIKLPLSKAGDLSVTAKDNMHEIVLGNGSRCVCLPSNPDTIRGFSAVDELYIDEAAMVEDGVYHVVRPMLMVSKGTLVMMSTPKGQRGFFYDAHVSEEAWDRYTVTCEDVPRFTAEDLARERKELGEWMYRQEYLCEFLSTLDAVFPAEQVRSSIDDDVPAFAW